MTMTRRNIAGAIETIDAAEQMQDPSGLSDLANQLRRDMAEFYRGIVDALDGALAQFGDDGDPRVQSLRDMRDQVSYDALDFAPELEDVPNPQTQPGDPNPSAAAERAKQE